MIPSWSWLAVLVVTLPLRDGVELRGTDAAPLTATCAAGQVLRAVQGGQAVCAALDLSIAPTLRTTFVSPLDFVPIGIENKRWSTQHDFIRRLSGNSASIRADVHVPDGAIVDSVSCQMIDDVAGDADTESLQWALALATNGVLDTPCFTSERTPSTGVSVVTKSFAQLAAACQQPFDATAQDGMRFFQISMSTTGAVPGGSTPSGLGTLGCTVRYKATAVSP